MAFSINRKKPWLLLVLCSFFFVVLGITSTTVWEYTNSDSFCTSVCHSVHPEEAYSHKTSQHARLRSPEEMLWTLMNYCVTPDKTVVITCNTNFWAEGGLFMFRYLGFPDVRVHAESWVGWTRWMEYIKQRLQE